MDTLMIIHLLIYPLITGGLLVGFVWASYRENVMLVLMLFWLASAGFILTLMAHVNYQEYFHG